jgi:hypothetical protein
MRMSQLSGSRLMVTLAAVVGFGAATLATLMSYWGTVGGTPAALYGRTAQLATLTRIGGLPIEFVAACWFAAVALLYLFAWTRGGRLPNFVFLSAVPFASAIIWQASARNFHIPTVTIAAAAAAVVLTFTALEDAPPLGDAIRHALGDSARALRRPLPVAAVLGFVSLSVMAAEYVVLKAESVSARLASTQEFRTWWSTQARRADGDLVRPDGIRLVAFTDYQCPACANAVPEYEAIVERFRGDRQDTIDLVVRDFPLEPECNPGLERDLHGLACETAAAVRLVGQRVGAPAAKELGSWFYMHRDKLTTDTINEQLDAHGLRAAYQAQYAEILKAIEVDVALGRRLGVHSTPTFFLDGVKLPDTSPRTFELALQYQVEQRSGGAGVTARREGGSGAR